MSVVIVGSIAGVTLAGGILFGMNLESSLVGYGIGRYHYSIRFGKSIRDYLRYISKSERPSFCDRVLAYPSYPGYRFGKWLRGNHRNLHSDNITVEV